MFYFCFLLCFSFLFSENRPVLTINDNDYSLLDFYTYYPKKQWTLSDSTKKEKAYLDFIKRNLCILEAKSLGLEKDPEVVIKIRSSMQQLLVNETYERLVAVPLINKETLDLAYKFAKSELFVHHILIGHSGSRIAAQHSIPERTIDEALLLTMNIGQQFSSGASFSDLAIKYSEDPSVVENLGELGWVGWGQTVLPFQRAAFVLDVGVVSSPVLTDFGYHLILVTDRRPSDLQYLSEEEYESAVVNISKAAVRNKLRGAAISYDSLQFALDSVHFNINLLQRLSELYNKENKNNILAGSASRVDVVALLNSLSGVVCIYQGRGLGGRWFSNKLIEIPPGRRPFFDSVDKILSFFKKILLRESAMSNGYRHGVDKSPSFSMRSRPIVSGILYDSYLKYLINSAHEPDSIDVQKYYDENKIEKYENKNLSLVFSTIEAKLRKKNQDLIKKDGINKLFDKYKITRHMGPLQSDVLENFQ